MNSSVVSFELAIGVPGFKAKIRRAFTLKK